VLEGPLPVDRDRRSGGALLRVRPLTDRTLRLVAKPVIEPAAFAIERDIYQ
jgi:hypothetical protein